MEMPWNDTTVLNNIHLFVGLMHDMIALLFNQVCKN
jgi:hypothetical protein